MEIITDMLTIRADLLARGYSFVTMNNDFISKVKQCEEDMNYFFNSDNKESYFREPVFGYFNVPHKEVFRFATGDKLDNYDYPSNHVKELSLIIDSFIFDFASKLFPDIPDTVPFNYGLIDIVKYNNNIVRPNDLNIVEHYDAGLLAFNFLSTAPGLEFKNEYNEWITPPSGGILWTGAANKIYQPGIHRVKTTNKPRLSMWYEICTQDQMREDILTDNYKGYQYEIDLMEAEGYDPVRNENDNIIGYKNKELSGYKALELATGSNKVAIGYNTLIIGENNTLIGFKALESVTTGSNKVAVGRNLGYGSNIAIGNISLK